MRVYRHDDNPDVVITEEAYRKKRADKEADILEEFSDISPEETDFFYDMNYRYTALEIWNMSEEEKEKIWRDYAEELVEHALKDWESEWEELSLEVEEE